jgi:hypothetical protein
MPADSQAVTRLQEDRVAAIDRLQHATEQRVLAEQAVVRWQNTEAQLTDEVADLDQAIALATDAP